MNVISYVRRSCSGRRGTSTCCMKRNQRTYNKIGILSRIRAISKKSITSTLGSQRIRCVAQAVASMITTWPISSHNTTTRNMQEALLMERYSSLRSRARINSPALSLSPTRSMATSKKATSHGMSLIRGIMKCFLNRTIKTLTTTTRLIITHTWRWIDYIFF